MSGNDYPYEEFTLAEFKKNLQIGASNHTVTVKLVRILDDGKVLYKLHDTEAGTPTEFEDEGAAKTEFMDRTYKYIGLVQPK